jgi:hypothetical protein
MRRSPAIVAETDDREIYLVLDDFGSHLGRAWPEADEERTDRETVVMADEVLQRLAIDGREVPARLEAFVEQHGSARPIQLPLPLRGAA